MMQIRTPLFLEYQRAFVEAALAELRLLVEGLEVQDIQAFAESEEGATALRGVLERALQTAEDMTGTTIERLMQP